MSVNRHREKSGEIKKKYGNISVRILRRIYGIEFARNLSDNEMLSDVFEALDGPSLLNLIRHHDEGSLERRISDAANSMVRFGGP